MYLRLVASRETCPAALLTHATDLACTWASPRHQLLAATLLGRDDLPEAAAEKIGHEAEARAQANSHPRDKAPGWGALADQHIDFVLAAWLLRPGRHTPTELADTFRARPHLARAAAHTPTATGDVLAELCTHPDDTVRAGAASHPNCPDQAALDAIAALDDHLADGAARGANHDTDLLYLALGGEVAHRHASELVLGLRTASCLPALFDGDLNEHARRHALTAWLPAALSQAADRGDLDDLAADTLTLLGPADNTTDKGHALSGCDEAGQPTLEHCAAAAWGPVVRGASGPVYAPAESVLAALLDRLAEELNGNILRQDTRALGQLTDGQARRLLTDLPDDADDRSFWQALDALADNFTGTVTELLDTAAGIAREAETGATIGDADPGLPDTAQPETQPSSSVTPPREQPAAGHH